MAEALKAEGNKAFAAKNFEDAVEKFSQAITLEPSNHVLYSNRSGAYASLKQWEKALEDAQKTTEIKSDWPKGWGRKGSALHGAGDLVGANEAFEEALKLDPTNAQAKSGLAAVKRAIEAEASQDGFGGDPSGGLGQIFNDPQMMQKLASNPKTAHLLADPAFMATLQEIKRNPSSMTAAMSDPRLLQVMGVLMGFDMSFGAPGDLSGDGGKGEPTEDIPMPDAQKSQTSKAPEPEPEPEDEEVLAQKKAKVAADEEKTLGTENYKKRQFDEAIKHYTKAWDLFKDVTYLTNLSAAQFEKGEYAESISTCQQAIEEGREVRTDFKIIAKAYGRIGSAYEKLDDLPNAIINYQKSLTEHRTPDILKRVQAAEKAKIRAEREAYINPEEADHARELGNQKFKEADWPAAVAAYTEMTKRAPDDPRGYSNRAAALIKLMTFPGAVTDCDEALKKDPKFIRAYIRKAQAYLAMKEYGKCLDTLDQALEHDEAGANRREIEQMQTKTMQAQFSGREGETEAETTERIQRDPDIMSILQDPVMQAILQQAKGDPAALQEHMRNPGIRTKIQKLVAAGVIRTR